MTVTAGQTDSNDGNRGKATFGCVSPKTAKAHGIPSTVLAKTNSAFGFPPQLPNPQFVRPYRLKGTNLYSGTTYRHSNSNSETYLHCTIKHNLTE